MNANKDMDGLKDGVEALATLLHSSCETGLDESGVSASMVAFGENKHKEAPAKNFLWLCWETIQDPIILLLIFAATVSTTLGIAIPEERAHNGWVEGVAIWVAVLVVVGVGAGNDWQKDRQFRRLNAQRDAIQVKVVRGGKQQLVSNTAVVVGDVLCLDTGDKVVADGVLIETYNLTVDEASLTGEGDPIKKTREGDPWVRSGTTVVEGSGKILLTAVGAKSEWGKILEMVTEEEDDQTPLQIKLEWVAMAVGKIGFAVAICCFIALLIQWCVKNNGFPISRINDNGPVQFFLYAITIIVVAVPEGLPLAVTISLAYSMKKMMQDNNFVRVLAACETMGGATAICSDKTGTLTENRMTVVTGWFCGARAEEVPEAKQLPQAVADLLTVNMAMNSKAFLTTEKDEAGTGSRVKFVGNITECALLMLLKSWGQDYDALRAQYKPALFKLFGFSSERKMSCCVIKEESKYVVHNKGAAEWVLARCRSQYTQDGSITPLSEEQRKQLLEEHVEAMAKEGLRCIALATCDLPLEDPNRPEDFFEEADNCDATLTLLAIVGIKDPVRKEVPQAVITCQDAGIVVRMVTGDNIHTARHIARECGILPENRSEYTAMEGPAFRALSEADMLAMLPNMRVLARSSPEDKRTLVKALRSLGEVVAVTGDGTNDAAALKASDVGLAMGIAGTEVAKEAADIIIMDDNFSSIVKSVLWGRSVFTNIRKFLQFQLTVNLVALVTAFIGSVVGGTEPLNVLQLLWVNMIMDSMGALALATENPTNDLLLLRPHGHDEPLITGRMWKHIFTQGIYQLVWMFLCLYALPIWIPSRYRLNFSEAYWNDNCVERITNRFDASSATTYCNYMTQCGFPYGESTRNTDACLLWQQSGGAPVATDERLAVCGDTATACQAQIELDIAQADLTGAYDSQAAANRLGSLSVLFNGFIMMQVANEVNSRRIFDEYDIFAGILHSPVFSCVIIITMGLQAIIINFLGAFFKTTPLDWKEWLATIAMGLGAWPVSLLVRYISRAFDVHHAHDKKTGVDHLRAARATRPGPARTVSRKAADGGSQYVDVTIKS